MFINGNVDVLSWRDGDWLFAKRTAVDSFVFVFPTDSALVLFIRSMVQTKFFLTRITRKGKEIELFATLHLTMFANMRELHCVAFRSRIEMAKSSKTQDDADDSK